jgi:hypothetical protein
MESIFKHIIPAKFQLPRLRSVMRCFLIFVYYLILIRGIFGQTSIEVLSSKVSPKEDIELQYTDNDSCICIDVWLVSKEDTTQRFMLDSAITLGTSYSFLLMKNG